MASEDYRIVTDAASDALPPEWRAVDLLVVGCGPVGATFARITRDCAPGARILVLDSGPALTGRPALHVKNIRDEADRMAARSMSQGPRKGDRAKAAGVPAIDGRGAATLARPGTHLLSEGARSDDDGPLAAAAMSTCVGGMGVHWTCATPRPGNTEKISFIDDEVWEDLIVRAEGLLAVTPALLPSSGTGHAIQAALNDALDGVVPETRKVQPLPLACRIMPDGRFHWTGPEAILGNLLSEQETGFRVQPETVCRRLIVEDGRVAGAIVVHLPSGAETVVTARAVAVACDALRTPQLLWASGMRHRALGHYLNDQPQILTGVALHTALRDAREASEENREQALLARGEPIANVYWVPFSAPTHPFHGQIMHMDLSPVQIEAAGGAAAGLRPDIVGMAWFCAKDIRFEDCVAFSETETDYFGLPRMSVAYSLTDRDTANIARATSLVQAAAAAIGTILPGEEPRKLPDGSSLHYQGTTRMGERDDGTSVCDIDSRVWGVENLFVGGNGVIPTAIACNPTLMSVALAVRGARTLSATLLADRPR